MEQGIVLCRQLKEHVSDITALGVSDHTIDALFKEIDSL
jgi:hypothetical protein